MTKPRGKSRKRPSQGEVFTSVLAIVSQMRRTLNDAECSSSADEAAHHLVMGFACMRTAMELLELAVL